MNPVDAVAAGIGTLFAAAAGVGTLFAAATSLRSLQVCWLFSMAASCLTQWIFTCSSSGYRGIFANFGGIFVLVVSSSSLLLIL